MDKAENSKAWRETPSGDNSKSPSIENLEGHRDSVVEVRSPGYYFGLIPRAWFTAFSVNAGSGFFVGKNLHSCEIATDAHNFDADVAVDVRTNDNHHYQARIEKFDAVNDLAILKIEGIENPLKTCPVLAVAKGEISAHVPVLMLTRHANEDSPGEFVAYESLKLLNSEMISGESDDRYMADLSLKMKPGNSGGPILAIVEGHVQVIGIADKAFHLSNVSYATPSYALRKDLDDLHREK